MVKYSGNISVTSCAHMNPAVRMAGFKSRFGMCFLLLIFGNCFQLTHGKRILLLPFPFISHARQLAIIGDDLASNGHEVYMALSLSFPDLHRFQGGKVRYKK